MGVLRPSGGLFWFELTHYAGALPYAVRIISAAVFHPVSGFKSERYRSAFEGYRLSRRPPQDPRRADAAGRWISRHIAVPFNLSLGSRLIFPAVFAPSVSAAACQMG